MAAATRRNQPAVSLGGSNISRIVCSSLEAGRPSGLCIDFQSTSPSPSSLPSLTPVLPTLSHIRRRAWDPQGQRRQTRVAQESVQGGRNHRFPVARQTRQIARSFGSGEQDEFGGCPFQITLSKISSPAVFEERRVRRPLLLAQLQLLRLFFPAFV